MAVRHVEHGADLVGLSLAQRDGLSDVNLNVGGSGTVVGGEGVAGFEAGGCDADL